MMGKWVKGKVYKVTGRGHSIFIRRPKEDKFRKDIKHSGGRVKTGKGKERTHGDTNGLQDQKTSGGWFRELRERREVGGGKGKSKKRFRDISKWGGQ